MGDWLDAGGLFITAGCLASLATLVVVLAVAVCLVRARLRRRRRRKMLPATTKIELQEMAPDEPAQPVHDPLLAGDVEMGQLSDVTLTDFESEPVRYVVSHIICIVFRLHFVKFLSPVFISLTACDFVPTVVLLRTLGWRCGLVVGRRTCDLVVAGSRPGRDAAA